MTQSFEAALGSFSPRPALGVAFSGGADSTALLAACARKWPGQVVALHVNHGLQAAAADFEIQCAKTCQMLKVPLLIGRVDARAATGESPEEIARQHRYRQLVELAKSGDAGLVIRSIAIAQHADDQIETLMLALSRGSGLAGLCAMPASWQREGLDFHRPLLDVSGAHIRSWLAEQQLSFVEDPSNSNEQFTRNRIRAQLLPALEKTFPQFRDTFARSVSHIAQAQELLDDLARADLTHCSDPVTGRLRLKELQGLSKASQANLLRHWLKTNYSVIPSSAQLAELQDQIVACRTRGHAIHIKVGTGFVRREGECLDWYNP